MKCTSVRLALYLLTTIAVMPIAPRETRAEVRRGFLYDLLHFGKGCGSACEPSPVLCAHWSLDAELEADKARMREEMRVHRLHLFLHNQDHKGLLHPECSPYHDCYWGIYPTCWRRFPGRQCCPQPDPVIYEQGGPYELPPYEMGPPPSPQHFETAPSSQGDVESPDLAPPAPQAPSTESEEPLYFE